MFTHKKKACQSIHMRSPPTCQNPAFQFYIYSEFQFISMVTTHKTEKIWSRLYCHSVLLKHFISFIILLVFIENYCKSRNIGIYARFVVYKLSSTTVICMNFILKKKFHLKRNAVFPYLPTYSYIILFCNEPYIRYYKPK